jgi:HAD superfamily hydrolase (TIGR01509 family)
VSVRAVIFDFNGTISDDEPVLDRLFCAMSADLGAPMTSADYYRDFAGFSDVAIVEKIVARSGAHADVATLLREKIARYKAIVSRSPTITEHAAAFVRAVADRVPVAIASGAVREEVEHVLRIAGLLERFGAIVTIDDVERGKPDPEGYLLALSRLDGAIAAKDVLVFEDADAGVQSAKAAGMRCAALRTPAYTGAPVRADVVLDRLDAAQVDALLSRAA